MEQERKLVYASPAAVQAETPAEHSDSLMPNREQLEQSMQLADLCISKNYLAHLEEVCIVEPDARLATLKSNSIARFFRIRRIAYDQQENVQDKLTSVFDAVAGLKSSVVLIINYDGKNVEYYMGVANVSHPENTALSSQTLTAAFEGNFPGSRIERVNADGLDSLINELVSDDQYVVSAVSGIASLKNEKQNTKSFIQGLEKLTEALHGRPYAAIILADSVSDDRMAEVQAGYESLYSQLVPFARNQLSLSAGDMRSFAQSTSESISNTIGKSVGLTQSYSHTSTSSDAKNLSGGNTKNLGGIVGSAISAGVGIVTLGIAGPQMAFATSSIASAVGNLATGALGTQSDNEGSTRTEGTSDSKSRAEQKTENESDTRGSTTGTTDSQTTSTGRTLEISFENRSVQTLLDTIDSQLERLKSCREFGLFNCAAYFISGDAVTSRIAANTYRALTLGENSSAECSHINTWQDEGQVRILNRYLSKFTHPVFCFKQLPLMPQVTAGSLVSGRELSIHMGLPQKSLPGLPVLGYAEFARNVVRFGENTGTQLPLGNIFHLGKTEQTRVSLQVDSLTRHTLITGTTGSGKSNTLYVLLDRLSRQGVHFMVIEPAKGEYKAIFGGRADVRVLGTNPSLTPMLRINPFVFSQGVHVLEHIDRVLELFNACWPMYAAMPAILKETVESAYIRAGWDFDKGVCLRKEPCFPNFQDLLELLPQTIKKTNYSSEVQGNYIGSLVTRVKSLAGGLYGRIFCGPEVENAVLFDENLIVDLSRLGSAESKALLMGVLVMRLQEYRMTHAQGHDSGLRHVTVLEEAHHLLRRSSPEQSQEGANLLGKSVEMISNAIAEMRTFGEGFLVADQSPSLLDMSVIRNTNTKITLRLPDEQDRLAVGRASGLNEEQIAELAKLQTGVAVVCQSDWVSSVLCQIDPFPAGSEVSYVHHTEKESDGMALPSAVASVMQLLFFRRLPPDQQQIPSTARFAQAAEDLRASGRPGMTELADEIDEYKRTGSLSLWGKEQFDRLARLLDTVFGSGPLVEACRRDAPMEWDSFATAYVLRVAAPMSRELCREILAVLLMCHGQNSEIRRYYYRWYAAVLKSSQ